MIGSILDYLEKAEGTYIHRHGGEEDITLPYGLYKQYDSEMYKYIVEIAKQNGIAKPSDQWDKDDIHKINILIDTSKHNIRAYAEKFYRNFLKNAHIDIFPEPCRVAMYSMYTHSPVNALKAVQRSIINMVKSFRLGLLIDEVSTEDGSWGHDWKKSKTKKSIEYISDHKTEEFHWLLEEAMLGNMTDIYIEIWDKEQKRIEVKGEIYNKYTKHLSGWKNRMAKLKAMR